MKCEEKIRFDNHDKHVAKRIAKRWRQRIYRCPNCDYWHLTKQPFRP